MEFIVDHSNQLIIPELWEYNAVNTQVYFDCMLNNVTNQNSYVSTHYDH